MPALRALAARGHLTIQAPRGGRDLYWDLDADVGAPREARPVDAAVLFPPSFRAAWQARHAARRVGTATDGRRWLLTDRVKPRRHRAQTYAALAAVVGGRVAGPPTYEAPPGWADSTLPTGHVGLNPLSVSGAVREWPRFVQLAQALQAPVGFYAGPGEGRRLRGVARGHMSAVGLPLPAFAASLRRCAVFVSNDSGAAHFARACGVPTLVIHGSTDPAHTGPDGSIPVGPAPADCAPCQRQRCHRSLECLEVPVAEVLRRLGEMLAVG